MYIYYNMGVVSMLLTPLLTTRVDEVVSHIDALFAYPDILPRIQNIHRCLHKHMFVFNPEVVVLQIQTNIKLHTDHKQDVSKRIVPSIFNDPNVPKEKSRLTIPKIQPLPLPHPSSG